MSSTLTTEKIKTDASSAKIIEDFRRDISELSSRVLHLETERQQWQEVVSQNSKLAVKLQQIDLQKDLLISGHQEEYQSWAKIFEDLKQPVDQVVRNLNEVFAEITDSKLQKSIQDCINTAESVNDSFKLSAAGLQKFIGPPSSYIQGVDLRQLLCSILEELQSDDKLIKLLVEQSIATKLSINSDLLKLTIQSVLPVLFNNTADNNFVTVTVRLLSSNANPELKNVVIEIKSNQPTTMIWENSWSASIDLKNNQEKIPFEWLAWRHNWREVNGDMQLLLADQQVQGVKIVLPDGMNATKHSL